MGDGEKDVQLRLVGTPAEQFSSLDFLTTVRADYLYPPAFLSHAERLYSRERVELDRARSLIQSLDQAISMLSGILSEYNVREQTLQECLEQNPILFGIEYRAVRKQLELGSEYRLDFALERWDGTCDMLEIEPSNAKLFISNNSPSAKLVHAEQQVLDWLRWASKFPDYAGRDFPGLSDPYGIVIIGRRNDLTSIQKDQLKQRNRLWRTRLMILTYDDLLAKAQTMFDRVASNKA